MIAPISFFQRNRNKRRRKPVKRRRMVMKMNGFATDSGSSKAVIPVLCMGRERKRAASSTITSIAGMMRRGRSRDFSII
ncbi:MAG: hypothetical protein BWY93_01661 [Euryarchaeota archaeon ADurb.BinA087]|nr:MAG: hypothetical protein BWY93_01661 [Euryarchaeota archaeon ADurb.BinA087]